MCSDVSGWPRLEYFNLNDFNSYPDDNPSDPESPSDNESINQTMILSTNQAVDQSL